MVCAHNLLALSVVHHAQTRESGGGASSISLSVHAERPGGCLTITSWPRSDRWSIIQIIRCSADLVFEICESFSIQTLRYSSVISLKKKLASTRFERFVPSALRGGSYTMELPYRVRAVFSPSPLSHSRRSTAQHPYESHEGNLNCPVCSWYANEAKMSSRVLS